MDIFKKIAKKINTKAFPKKLFFGPEWIILGVNNTCNLKCRMCDVGTKNQETNFAQNLTGSHPMNMPIELFKKIIDQAEKHYPKAKIGYAFTEPLIYKDLRESLRYASQKGFRTSITTNAFNLAAKADDLISGKLSELFISLDGLEKTHNYIRGNKQSFQKALEGIHYIAKSDYAPEISIFNVLTEWNYKEAEAFVDYFSDLPIKQLGFLHQNFITKRMADDHNGIHGKKYPATHSNVQQVDFSKIDLDLLYKNIQAVKSKKYPFKISFSPELKDRESLYTYYTEPEKKIGKICNDVFTNIMIKTDGSAIPAHGRCYNISMGNIYKNTLDEIWNSIPYGQFRKNLMLSGGLFPACTRCCSAF